MGSLASPSGVAEVAVVPHERIGPIKLGMSRDESRKAMVKAPNRSFKRLGDKVESDFYDNGFELGFDDDRRVNFVQVASGLGLMPVYGAFRVFETLAEEVVREISSRAELDREDPTCGYTICFIDIDLMFWREIVPEPDDPPDHQSRFFDTVAIGSPGNVRRSRRP